jgi:hypothetical protein
VWILDRLRALLPKGSQPPASAEEIGGKCSDWRQGDVFQGAPAYKFGSGWTPFTATTTYGAAVVSQSCDAAQSDRPHIQIAPVVELHGNVANEAAAGRRPQYAPLPQLGDGYYADLDVITTVAKTVLLDYQRTAGVATDDDVRKFAFAVSRKFSRFAYPDEVVASLRPVKTALQSKARKPNSRLGKVLAKIHSLRVQCEDWTTGPLELTLIVIVEPDVVPSDLEEIGSPPTDLPGPDLNKPLAEQENAYATYLSGDDLTPTQTYFAWQYLSEVWALRCEQTATDLDHGDLIASIAAELTSVDEFPLARVLRSDSLDLDYLSDSRKPSE